MCRVSPEWIARYFNEPASAIQPRGMVESPKCLRSLRNIIAVGIHRNQSGETGRPQSPFIDSL
eukprot:14303968-Heterocapsa_arctica.AAC.1